MSEILTAKERADKLWKEKMQNGPWHMHAEAEIAELREALYTKNSWIKVEDKLPPESHVVEVYVPKLGSNFGRFYAYTYYGFDGWGDKLIWLSTDVEELIDVVYWRELEPVPDD